jgi:hypothetical protein
MLHQKLLNLSWVNVFTASNNEILRASNYLDVALVINLPEISSMHPPIDYRLFRLFLISPVALHDGIATGAHFTWLTPWKDLMCLWMSNLDLNVWAGAANCCSFLEFLIILVTNRDDWGSLSHSIALGQVLDSELFRNTVHQGLGGTGSGYESGA